MGDRYQWDEPCPKCGANIECYYAESCEMTTARCDKCGAEFGIVMGFKLIERLVFRGKLTDEETKELQKPGKAILTGSWRTPVF